ncbi:MAG TPA: hypothetical protein VGM68_11315 [Rhizomicrobium sp.]|jgi:hypothetical protein
MSRRESFTTSERELICAMAREGRQVTLANLSGWRKEGLLPPLASNGRGTGKGRSYYWKNPDILGHACTTFDLLKRYRRAEIVLWMLWVHGHQVPIPQFRRVWAARTRSRPLWAVHPSTQHLEIPEAGARLFFPALQGQGGATYLLLQATLALSGTLVPDDGDAAAITQVIGRALAWITRVNHLPTPNDDLAAERLWLTVRIVSAALEASDLVSSTTDSELREAQRYLQVAGRLLQKCDDRSLSDEAGTAWPAWLAERMAAPTFLLILVLARLGYGPMLDDITERLEKLNRRSAEPPVQPLHAAF